ncbi:hypothetical protein RclHR1_01310003 [Rhizophagus clarus]|uniref:ASX DEUBAD domain-containing protein n=1 Tax=Rhizophagus clarus TaxID=94130 RepID=A0A2Z6Q969_9GLOM|nr:hypothetical protein RclHR1_01310003 [Rhizophagus clarus]GES91760.1 hypothetical protein RCL_jg13998.t1 [Rhizophagus clarus]
MPRKRISRSNTNSTNSVFPPSTSVRRSTRIKRDEIKDEQLSNKAAAQEVFSENEETQPKLTLPKKRTKPISPVPKSTHTKKARNEDNEQQQIEETKIEVPDNGNQESETIQRKYKGKSKVIEPSYGSNTEDTSSTSFMSLKSLFNEKLSITTPLSNISKHGNSEKMNIDESDLLVQEKWEKIKEQLFEVPKKSLPLYQEYQDRLFTKQPWMKKKDVDYLQKLITEPKSMLARKQLKSLFNFQVYNNFTDDQKGRLLKLLPNCDLVPIANDNGDPIDTPRIEREYKASGLDLYEAGVSEPVGELDPNKVCPRFDFWLSDAFKDARWWFQTSIRYGYNTEIGVDTQWINLEKFKTEVPKNWKNDDYEQEWGLGLWGKLGKKQIAGESAKISLPEMAKAQIIRLNDTLKYKRQFKNIGITILMDLKVVAINKSNGHLQLELFKGEQSKIIYDIHNPTRLENEVLDFDGRVAKSSRPNGNAFKNFSIVRSDDYSPSLFEARKEYWAKNQ